MRVGVTGATGFVGSALARRHLERGDSVRCLSRRAPTPGTTIPDVQIVTGGVTPDGPYQISKAGAGMRNRSIAQMIRTINRGLFFAIGRRGASANYVHVASVVDALVLCGTSPQAVGRTYKLSDWTTVEEFARTTADALAQPRPRIRLPERPVHAIVGTVGAAVPLPLTEGRIDGLVSRVRYPAERIQRELDYLFSVSIEAGLADMVAHEAGR